MPPAIGCHPTQDREYWCHNPKQGIMGDKSPQHREDNKHQANHYQSPG